MISKDIKSSCNNGNHLYHYSFLLEGVINCATMETSAAEECFQKLDEEMRNLYYLKPKLYYLFY